MEGEHVRPLQDLVECRAALRVVADHRHAESPGTLRDGPADPTHADDAEHRAAQLEPAEEERRPPWNRFLAHHAVARDDVPGTREKERPREVGGRVGEHAGRVRDDDAARASRLEVDVVGSDGVARDRADGTGVEHLGIDPVREHRQEPYSPPHPARGAPVEAWAFRPDATSTA